MPTIQIPKPCHESWAAMTPAGAGRHCAACQKTVVDFSQKTDAEILAALRQAAGPTCGRLRPDQLDRPLGAPTAAPRWRAWLGAALAVISTVNPSKASTQVSTSLSVFASPVMVSPASDFKQTTPLATPSTHALFLSGTVVDASTGEHLPGVLLRLKGNQQEVTTDADGNFSLLLPTDSKRITLVATYVGYETTVKVIKLAHATEPLRLRLKMTHAMLGEIAYGKPAGNLLQRLTAFFS
jgi:hypothetical protein